MNPHDAFLQEILARPDDDIPRLIYADWLEEQGDIRCELIRVQCAVWGMEDHHPDFHRLRKRELSLLRRHKTSWLGPIAKMTFEAKFHRGFVQEITLGARQFLNHQETLFNLAPIRRVNLSRLTVDTAREMAETQNLHRLGELRLAGGGMTGRITERLFSSPHWSQLRRLIWRGVLDPLAHAGLVEALGRLPLETFALEGVYLGERHAQLFQAIAPNPTVQRLDLSGAGLGVEGAGYLASTPCLVNLRELNLAHNLIEDEGLQRLAESPHVQQLESLDLTNNTLRGEGLRRLLATLQTPRLMRLNLAQNPLFPEAIALLTTSPALERLEHLKLNHVVVGDDTALRRILENASLVTLRLSGCRVGDAAVRELAKTPNAAKLRLLDLGDNRLTDEAADALLASPHLERLTRLDLRYNRIGRDRQRALRRRFGRGVCVFSR